MLKMARGLGLRRREGDVSDELRRRFVAYEVRREEGEGRTDRALRLHHTIQLLD